MSDNALARLYRRLLMLVGRGRLTVVDDSGPIQMVQIRLGADEVVDAVPRMAEYGFTSNPPLGTDAVTLSIMGVRPNCVVIATGNQTARLKSLAAGDTAQYDSRGAYLWFKPGGIVIDGAGLPMTIQNVGTLTVKGDLHVTGVVIAGYGGGDQVGLQTHKHTQGSDTHGDGEVPTDPPIAGT